MNFKSLLTSVFICSLVLYGINVPTYWCFISFLIFGILGLRFEYLARFFIFGNIVYSVFLVLYSPIISSVTLFLPNVQPKVITTLILTIIISAFGGILLSIPKKINYHHLSKFIALSFILFGVFGILINKLSYDLLALPSILLVVSYCAIEVFSNFGIYDYKVTHIKFFLFFFLSLTLLNFFPLERSTKTIGIVKNHSVWAREEIPYNQQDWTLRANYSYSLFMQVLSKQYDVLPLATKNDLKDKINLCDTVLILTPTIPFSPEEKGIIRDYVLKGGKILFIGDHTDLYGHARVINDVLSNWGVSVNYDALFSPENWYGKVRLRNSKFGAVRPLTGASLLVLRPSNIIAWSHNWVSEAANYNEPNFFGDLMWTGDDRYGDFPMGVVSNVGSGYVTVFSDSTIFSNFALYQPRVLDTLKYLIEKGSFLSLLAFYYPIFLLLFIFTLIIPNKKIKEGSILAIFIFSALTGGTYLIYNITHDGFYSHANQIKIFCQEDYLRESLPNQDPKPYSISNLYSNLARFDLHPDWKGEEPTGCSPDEKCIWFTTSDEFNSWNGNIPKFIVLVDDSNKLTKLGYEKRIISTVKNVVGLPEYSGNRYTWVLSNSAHTMTIRSSQIFSSFGVIDDIVLGNWWTSTDVSPYRKEMVNRFSNWIKYRHDISSYHYPPVGIRKGNKNMIMTQKEGGTTSLNNIDVVPFEYNRKKYVYLGGELWGTIKQEDNEINIIGGPETSDNYLRNKKNRFLGSIKIR